MVIKIKQKIKIIKECLKLLFRKFKKINIIQIKIF